MCLRTHLRPPGQDECDLLNVLGTSCHQALLLNLGDPAQSCIAMTVQLFGIGEAAFDGFFSSFVDPFTFRCEALVVDLFFMLFPYVAGDHFYVVSALGAFAQTRTLCADGCS